jgi:hypothetical protein
MGYFLAEAILRGRYLLKDSVKVEMLAINERVKAIKIILF